MKWIKFNGIEELPLCTPLYIKTVDYGSYIGYLEMRIASENEVPEYYDEYGDGYVHYFIVPELNTVFDLDDVQAYCLVPKPPKD